MKVNLIIFITLLLTSLSCVATAEEPYWVEPKNSVFLEVLNWGETMNKEKDQCPHCGGSGYTSNCEECICPYCLGTGSKYYDNGNDKEKKNKEDDGEG